MHALDVNYQIFLIRVWPTPTVPVPMCLHHGYGFHWGISSPTRTPIPTKPVNLPQGILYPCHSLSRWYARKTPCLINQVRMSSEGVCEYLTCAYVLQNIKPIELHLWFCTRWGSLSHCLESMLEVQKVSLNLMIFLIDYFTLYRQLTTFAWLPMRMKISLHLRKNLGRITTFLN